MHVINLIQSNAWDQQGQTYRHVIKTTPGIGPILVADIAGESGDNRRFPNAPILIVYSCLDTTVKGHPPGFEKRTFEYISRVVL